MCGRTNETYFERDHHSGSWIENPSGFEMPTNPAKIRVKESVHMVLLYKPMDLQVRLVYRSQTYVINVLRISR